MSDFELPDLPSDEDLGITEADREKYGEKASEDAELSPDELAALLDEGPAERRAGAAKKGKSDSGDAGGSAGGPTAPSLETEARRPVSEGPRGRWKGVVTLAALVAVGLTASTRTGQPRPVPANAPDTVFSSARAMSLLVDIARRPRPTGSPEHARVRQLLLDRLSELGLETEVQTTTVMAQVPGAARAATVRNVVGRLSGTAPTGAVLISAHYDSRELAPGAADDGAGLVAILEAVRALGATGPVRNDVIVLFTDAEEPCLCGARAFVQEHRWIDDVAVVLNFEMRGAGGPSLMFETGAQNGWIVQALEQVDPPPYANSLGYEVYRRMPNNTDFTEFRAAGKQGLNFAALDRAYVYHQASDRPENLSEATLQHHGTGALATLRSLGEADLRSVDAPDVTYLTVPLVGLVVYEAAWILPLSGLLLALALMAWLVVRARGGRVSGMIVGLGVAVLGGALCFGIGLWLRSWVTGYFPEAGSLSASVIHREGWWVLSAAAASFFVVTSLHGVARRWLSAAELATGALVLPLIGAVAASVYLPMGALNLQWPVAAALAALIVGGLLGQRSSGAVGWVASVILALPVLLVLVPVTELVWLAMSAELIAVLAVAMALVLYLCLPALDWLRHPNSWWAPVAGLVVAAASFGMGVLGARPNADRPAPSTLAYAYEHGTPTALWLTDPAADPVLDADAIAWANEQIGLSFSRTRDMVDFGYPAGETPVADARPVEAPLPTVLVQEDSIEGAVRRVALVVRSNLGAELLRFQLDPAGDTRLLSIDGLAIEQLDELEWAEHYGAPAGDGVRLELSMPAEDPIGLYVLEHLFRPDELLGAAPFERPEHLMPDVSTMSDRAAFKYSVAALADPRYAFTPGALLRRALGGALAPSLPPTPDASGLASDSAGPSSPPPAASDSIR